MRIARTLLLGLLLLLALLAALLWMLPAEFALRLANERLQPLQLGAVSGTVWNGRALSASVLGQPIGQLRWRLHPLPFLRGALVADVELEGRTAGRGRLDQRGALVRIGPAELTLPASVLEPALDVPALRLRGDIVLALDHVLLRDGLPESVQGQATWRGAAVAGAAVAELGGIVAEFRTQAPGSITGRVRDTGGPLQADGTFSAGYTGYQAEVWLRARDGNPQVEEALAHVGPLQPDGSTRFALEGRLLAW